MNKTQRNLWAKTNIPWLRLQSCPRVSTVFLLPLHFACLFVKYLLSHLIYSLITPFRGPRGFNRSLIGVGLPLWLPVPHRFRFGRSRCVRWVQLWRCIETISRRIWRRSQTSQESRTCLTSLLSSTVLLLRRNLAILLYINKLFRM